MEKSDVVKMNIKIIGNPFLNAVTDKFRLVFDTLSRKRCSVATGWLETGAMPTR